MNTEKTMSHKKDTPTQSATTGPKPKVTELYWIKTESATLTLERVGHPKVYRDLMIIWEAERDEVPFSYEGGASEDLEGIEVDDYFFRLEVDNYVRRLLTFEEAQSVLSILETEIEGVHLLSRVSLPIEREKIVPAFMSSNSSSIPVEAGSLLVRGHYDLETATYVGEERDGVLYRTVQLDLPVELADRLEGTTTPENYIAGLESVNEKVRQLKGMTESAAYIAGLEREEDKVRQLIRDIVIMQPDP